MDCKKSNLYTKTGDNGMSSLYNGERVKKDSVYFECLGDLDELNSNLGLVKAFWRDEMDSSIIKLYNAPGAGAMFYKHEKCVDSGKYYEWFNLSKYIHEIQCNLMNISTQIATPIQMGSTTLNTADWVKKVGLDTNIISILEKNIDRLDSILPPIKNFVVPSGNKLISQIHICRSITRRCERTYVRILNWGDLNNSTELLLTEQMNIPKIYLNRLSDYFFALSRFVAMTLEIEEDLYSRNLNKK
jgi:cob(I)alamin adenosyltransferase